MLAHYERFYLDRVGDLQAECDRLGVSFPVAEDAAPLHQSLALGGLRIPNRLWVQPMQAADAQEDGAPSDLTRQRYRAYARGGFGLIWLETTALAAESRTQEHQLGLHHGTAASFASLVREMKCDGPEGLCVILQLGVGAASVDRVVETVGLAVEAGFDGIDIPCGPSDPLYASHDRLEALLPAIHRAHPDLLLATRLCLYDACPGGFGVDETDYRRPDPAEAIALLRRLMGAGLSILNPSNMSPHPTDGKAALAAFRPSDEHALLRLQRDWSILQQVMDEVPGLHCVAGGLGWLRHLALPVGLGMLEEDGICSIGFGRHAMANPGLAQDLLNGEGIHRGKGCMMCHACNDMLDAGGPVGCVIQDPGTYGTAYRTQRRFDPSRLQKEAARCHQCETAPCMVASPSSVPIPECMRLFARGRFEAAFRLLQKENVLPELSAHLCPSWLQAEAACVETILSGNPVPIGDVQMMLARWAQQALDIGIRIPEQGSGRRIAVVGGGPAGIAASTRLLEAGHEVSLYEREKFLGGVPERVIPASRLPSARGEIDALLRPALEADRLVLKLGTALGRDVQVEELRGTFDAVLFAMGLGEEASLGTGRGVVDALGFLKQCKDGDCSQVPERVVILAGGDCAMDAAREAKARGTRELWIVYGGPRSEMHWHLQESWFAEPGVHLLVLQKPLGYVFDPTGTLQGVKLQRMDPKGAPLPDSESLLEVDFVIEAMALRVASEWRGLEAACADDSSLFCVGAMCNGGASVEQCIAEGLRVGEDINRALEALT